MTTRRNHTEQHLRIGVRGRLSESTARTLGGWIDERDGGFELVVPYVDRSQVTGLLVRLDDLHIEFRHVLLPRHDGPSVDRHPAVDRPRPDSHTHPITEKGIRS